VSSLEGSVSAFFSLEVTFVAQLVEGVRSVRDELAQEDLLVRVERVDDQRHELRNLSLERECFFGAHFS
jgi:hypothetical protein